VLTQDEQAALRVDDDRNEAIRGPFGPQPGAHHQAHSGNHLARQACSSRRKEHDPVFSGPCSHFEQMAERAGFEPAMEFDPHTRLAGECLQPLGHLSRWENASLEACVGMRARGRGPNG
jgi:hypothetical protein